MSAGMLSVIFVWLVAAIGVVIMKKLQPETWILYLVWVVVVCILLLGKDVYCSDAMPKMAAKATAVYYGDFSGLAVKVAEDANIEVLREKYATQHAVGVVAWMEIDTKVEDSQKIAKLTMASA